MSRWSVRDWWRRTRVVSTEPDTPVAPPPGLTEAAEDPVERPDRPDLDPLTHLGTHRSLVDGLAEQDTGAVIHLHVDHTAVVDDTPDPEGADAVLRTVATRLRAGCPSAAVVARVADEEFAVLAPGVSLAEAEALAAVLVAAVGEPVTVGGSPRTVTACAGVARTPRRESLVCLAVARRCTAQARAGGDRVVTEDALNDVRAGRRDLTTDFHQLRDQQDGPPGPAVADQLTGLPNREAFDRGLRTLHLMSEREKRWYAVVRLDLDRFQDLNLARGPEAGDRALRECARALQAACREGDVVYRTGGDDLVALLVDTDDDGAEVLAERLRLAVLGAAVPRTDEPGADLVTVSGGIATYDPAHPTPAGAVVAAAERTLATAKRLGGDRMEYEPPPL